MCIYIYIYIYIYILYIYMQYLNHSYNRCIRQITPSVQGQRKFATGQGVYQWQTCNHRGQGLYICGMHPTSRGLYHIYYEDVILVLCT